MTGSAKFHKVNYKSAAEGVINAYAEVFFSNSKLFGGLLLVITFFDWPLGVAGLLSVIVANSTAHWLGLDKYSISKGYFGFNALLTGLGLAMYFDFGPILVFMVVIAALLSLFLTVATKGFLSNYGLPFLSLPFLLALWLILLASNDFVNLGLSERGIYTLNTLYSRGGLNLINFYQWLEDLPLLGSVQIYLRSLAAIFFQQNIFAGILIALGLLWFSRIAFSLSLIGFYAAYLFYMIIGADFETLNYTYVGFNYILTSVAIGGYFLVPSKTTYLWIILIIPLLATLTMSLSRVFAVWHLSIYSLPFNIMVILFLYVLKFRGGFNRKPVEVIIQNNSPEKNLYSWKNERERFGNKTLIPIKLPFYGTWSVSQGHNGEYTHQGEWQHAWDFIILNGKDEQYKNEGYNLEDYYCFDKTVIAPADGVVVQVVNNIEDNRIGDVDIVNNWGNTVVIKHSEYLFSKMSHLRENSITVSEGQPVKFGTVIGKCGNSGRSPYPHLHFQLQSTPFIGSTTLRYPIASYLTEENGLLQLNLFSIPGEHDKVANIQPDDLLSGAFHFIPGARIKWQDDTGTKIAEWEIKSSVYNKLHFFCMETNSYAWFENDGALFYFTHFDGDRNSLLYHFYRAAFMIQLSFKGGLEIQDKFPVNKIFKPSELILQDFAAPFYMFKKAAFQLKYAYLDNEAFPSEIKLESLVEKTSWGKTSTEGNYELTIDESGIRKMKINTGSKQFEAVCIKE